MPNIVDQEKRRRQLAMQFPRNGIHHPGGMTNQEKPKVTRHLFFSEIGMAHMHHSLPVQFDQSVCQLTTSCGCHDVGVVVNEMLSNGHAKQFGVTIQTETVSIGPGISFEVMQGQKNGIPQEVLQTIHPVVAGSAIHQDEGVAKTPP
jgi:hypothetical protein